MKKVLKALESYPDDYFSAVVTVAPELNATMTDLSSDDFENVWDAITRVIKPGANVVALTLDDEPYNYATTCACVRMAGLEVRDTIQILHTTDVSKKYDLFDYVVKLVMPPDSAILLDPFQRDDLIERATVAHGHSYVGIPR